MDFGRSTCKIWMGCCVRAEDTKTRRILVNLSNLAGCGRSSLLACCRGLRSPNEVCISLELRKYMVGLFAVGKGSVPSLLITATVPHPAKIYASSSTTTLFGIAGFGVCSGIGATLTGVGLTLLAIGLGMAIILGLSASLGSLIPLFMSAFEEWKRP